MMKTNWLRYLMLSALLLNVVAIGIHYYLVYQIKNHQPFPIGMVIPPISGVSANGDLISGNTNNGYKCHVIRYTSIHCHWCLQDESAWQDFDNSLQTQGCDSVVLAPSVSDLPNDIHGSVNRKFVLSVSPEVAAKLDLFATPTTIVVDRGWKVLWSRAGVLTPSDKKRVLSYLR